MNQLRQDEWTRNLTPQDIAIADAARKIGATPADIPGLWNAPGFPELTTGQLLAIGAGR